MRGTFSRRKSRTVQRIFAYDDARPELGPELGSGLGPELGPGPGLGPEPKSRMPAEIGFGAMPAELRACEGSLSEAVSVRPTVVSLSYVGLGEASAHAVRIEAFEKEVSPAEFGSGAPELGLRWRQVLFAEPSVRSVYGSGVCIPVSEDSGNPFGLRFVTTGRGGPSMVVLDWEWAPWRGSAAAWRFER